jgi:hypothetical protein
MNYAIPTGILILLSSCTTPAPERAPIIPPAPVPIIITVRGGDQSTRSEHPIYERYLERRPEPEYEETLYQRKPVYQPEPLEREPYPSSRYVPQTYTRPDAIEDTPLEYRPKYPYYSK